MTKAVNVFVTRDAATGISLDLTIVGEEQINAMIRDIEEHAATTVLVELAEELRAGLAKVAQDRRDRADYERRVAAQAPIALAAEANGMHALAVVGKGATAQTARTVHAYFQHGLGITLCNMQNAHVVASAERPDFIEDGGHTFEECAERFTYVEKLGVWMKDGVRLCKRCVDQVAATPLDEIDERAEQAAALAVEAVEAQQKQARRWAERVAALRS